MSHFTNDPDPLGHTRDERADEGACPNCDGTGIDPDSLGTCPACYDMRTTESIVYETTRRAMALGLSFAQMSALEWLVANSPANRMAYRKAGFSTMTLHSLHMRGKADWNEETYSISAAGRAAIAKAAAGVKA